LRISSGCLVGFSDGVDYGKILYCVVYFIILCPV
jgi:hypothetical protein